MRLNKAKVEAIMKEMIELDQYTDDAAKEPIVIPRIQDVTDFGGYIKKVQLSDYGIHVVTDCEVQFFTYDAVIGFTIIEGRDEEDEEDDDD